MEAETNLAKPSELIVDKNGPAAGVFIVFALKSPNIVALVPITTDPVITPLPSKKKFDDDKSPSDYTFIYIKSKPAFHIRSCRYSLVNLSPFVLHSKVA